MLTSSCWILKSTLLKDHESKPPMKTIGQDLAIIRKHLGISISDIQHRTKLSQEIIKGIEDGTAWLGKGENVYLRIYMRSYARALNIDEDVMIKALDQAEVGNYGRLLIELYPDLKRSIAVQTVSAGATVEKDTQKNPSEHTTAESVEVRAGGLKSHHDGEDASDDGARDPKKSMHDRLDKGHVKNRSRERLPSTLKENGRLAEEREVNWAQVGRKFNQAGNSTSWKKMVLWILILGTLAGLIYILSLYLSF